MNRMDVVITGVGGQGTLLASKILGALALNEGNDVKVSEVHGMAQRGGSVVTYVRVGEDVASPVVSDACADYVLSFELMEAARSLPFLKKDGVMIASTQRIPPMPVVTGAEPYPGDLPMRLGREAVLMDALQMANEAGESRAVNLVLLGALSVLAGGEANAWEQAIRSCVPQKAIDTNLRAFYAGRRFIERRDAASRPTRP